MEKTIVSASCPQCGAPLVYNEANNTMTCEHCGTISLDARHEYKHLEFSRDFESELEHYIMNANSLMDSKFYSDADDAYIAATKKFSYDPRGWWGLARARSKDFTMLDITAEDFEIVERSAHSAAERANGEAKQEYLSAYEDYKDRVITFNKAVAAMYKKQIWLGRLGNLILFLLAAGLVVFCFFYDGWVIDTYGNGFVGDEGNNSFLALGLFALPVAVFGLLYGIASIIMKSGCAFFFYRIAVIGAIAVFSYRIATMVDYYIERPEEVVFVVCTAVLLFGVAGIIGFILTRVGRNRI